MAGLRSIPGKHVTFEENDYWKCNYCPQKSNGRPYRIIAHLNGKEKQAIKICPGLTPEEMEKIDREVKTVEQQLQQQGGEKDDTGQKKGNKKRKFASGSGTSGSDPTEAVMPPAIREINSVSEGYPRGVERSLGFEPHNYSPLLNPDVVYAPPGIWFGSMMVSLENCSLPSDEGRSHIPIVDNPGVQESNALAMLENNNDGVKETNNVGSEPNNTMHRGMEMDLGDQIPPPSPPVPPQHGVGTDAPALGNTSGVRMARGPDFANPPPCPPSFDSDLWDFYLKIDG